MVEGLWLLSERRRKINFYHQSLSEEVKRASQTLRVKEKSLLKECETASGRMADLSGNRDTFHTIAITKTYNHLYYCTFICETRNIATGRKYGLYSERTIYNQARTCHIL